MSISIEGDFLVIRLPIPETLKPKVQLAVADQNHQWTPRQLEVLNGIRAGLCNKEIANQLHIEVRTVKFHVSNILGKLGVTSRIEAMARNFSLDKN